MEKKITNIADLETTDFCLFNDGTMAKSLNKPPFSQKITEEEYQSLVDSGEFIKSDNNSKGIKEHYFTKLFYK